MTQMKISLNKTNKSLYIFTAILYLLLIIQNAYGIDFKSAVQSKKIMVIFTEKTADGLDRFAENIFKDRLRELGYKMTDPELMEKVRKDSMLMAAINNNNATQLAQLSTNMGADILIKGIISVESHKRFTDLWESSASFNISIINTATAEEIMSAYSEPMGSTSNPMPVESSELTAKQVAVKKVVNELCLKLGLSLSEGLRQVKTLSPVRYKEYTGERDIYKIKFSPDGHTLAAVNKKSIEIIDTQSGLRGAEINISKITAISFTKDNKFLAAASGSDIYIYEIDNPKTGRTLKAADSAVTSLSFNNTGSLLASGEDGGHIEVWDVSSGKIIWSIKGHEDKVNGVVFTPNNDFLISTSNDLLTKFWDINLKREKRSSKEPYDKMYSSCLSMDGGFLAYSVKDIHIDVIRHLRRDSRYLIIRDTTNGEEIRKIEIPKDILAIAFYPNMRYIASSSEDNKIKIWDIQSGTEISIINIDTESVSLDFSNNGGMLAYAAGKTVFLSKL